MKLHLPQMIRKALMASLAIGCVYGCNLFGAEAKRYWMDAQGTKHMIEEQEVEGSLNMDADAVELVLSDCVAMYGNGSWESGWFDGGAAMSYIWSEDVGNEIISAKTVTISGNILLSGSEVGEGGALILDFGNNQYTYGIAAFSFSGCDSVRMTNNGVVVGKLFTDEGNVLATGGAISVIGSFTYSDSFDGKYTAVYRTSALEFKNNKHVLIRGNYITDGDHHTMNAIGTLDADVSFAAPTGGIIECYDGLDIDGLLWINTTKPELRDEKDATYTGTVILSGEHVAEDLAALSGGKALKDCCIEESASVYAEAVYVARGRLILKDTKLKIFDEWNNGEMLYQSMEHQFYADAQAEVQITDTDIYTNWFDVYENEQYGSISIARVTYTGRNTFYANYVYAKGIWTFNVDAQNKADAVLSIVFNHESFFDTRTHVFDTTDATFNVRVKGSLAKGVYKLLEFDTNLGEWVGIDSVTLSGLAAGKIGTGGADNVYYTVDDDGMCTLWFDYAGGKGTASIELPPIASTLNHNQLSVYRVFLAMEASGELDSIDGGMMMFRSVAPQADEAKADAPDELQQMAEAVLSETDPDTLKSLLDRLDGAELATAMTSQMQGNLAHLRRLREQIGSGQHMSKNSKYAAYMTGYDDTLDVKKSSAGLGIRRSEWGGMVGFEGKAEEKTLIGIALSNGRARVEPSGAAHYHEEVTRVDLYLATEFEENWKSVSSIGIGIHEFDVTRVLPFGYASSAAFEGFSVNMQEEISYTIRTSEEGSVQPFVSAELSINHIGSFSESGAGTASLVAGSQSAVAADITLGARYIHTFAMSGSTGSVRVQAGMVMSAGNTASDIDLRFKGAPNHCFTVGTAGIERVGAQLGAGVVLPISEQASVIGAFNAILRNRASETSASVGIRLQF